MNGRSWVVWILTAVLGLLTGPSVMAETLGLLSAQYGSPTAISGGLACLLTVSTSAGDSVPAAGARGLVVGASGGSGGGRLELGYAALYLAGSPFMGIGLDARVNVTRTWGSPQGASPGATYVGLEGAVLVTVVRLSAGIGQRIAGPSGAHDTVFTWTAGIQLPFGH